MGMFDFLRGPRNLSGVTVQSHGISQVDLDRAVRDGFRALSVVYACVMGVAYAAAALDLVVEKDDGSRVENHPVGDLFNRYLGDIEGVPPPMSCRVYREVIWQQKELTGQHFSYIHRDGGGNPIALRPIFHRVEVVVSRDYSQVEGFWAYPKNGGRFALLPEEVLWDRYSHPSEPWGAMSPLQAASWAADTDSLARMWQQSELKNGSRSSGVVYLGDVPESAAQRAEAQFRERNTGPSNAGKTMFTWGAQKPSFERIGMTPDEMSYVASREFNWREIALAFRYPQDLLFGQSTFDNQDSAHTRLWAENIVPKLDGSASEIDRQLIPDLDLTAKWDTGGVEALKEAEDSVYKRVREIAMVDGLMLDEMREKIGLEPLPGGIGQMTLSPYRAQFGFNPLGGGSLGTHVETPAAADIVAAEELAPGIPAARVDRLEAMGIAAIRRLADKQKRVVERAAKRGKAVFDQAYWDTVAEETLGEWLAQAQEAGVEVRVTPKGLNRRSAQLLEQGRSAQDVFDDLSRRAEVLVRKAPAHVVKAEEARQRRLAGVQERGVTWLRDEFRRQQGRVLVALGGTNRALKNPLPDDIESILADFAAGDIVEKAAYRIHQLAMEEAVNGAAEDFGLDVSWSLINPKLTSVIERLAQRVTNVDDTTRDALRNAISEGLASGEDFKAGIADRVSAVFADAVDWRSLLIARTESMQAYGAASIASYREVGVQVEMYDGTSDEECAAVNGMVVSPDEAEALMAEEHPNGTRGCAPVVDLGLGSEE